MKRKIHIILIVLSLIAGGVEDGTAQSPGYPPPERWPVAPDFEVFIDQQPIHVYNTRSAAYAAFTHNGKVEVIVRTRQTIFSHAIRPLKAGVKSTVYRNEIHLTLDSLHDISVEINNNLARPLFLFSNPVATPPADRKRKGLYYFEKGKVHQPGLVKLKSNDEVYIEGGAVVRGSFIVDNATGVKIHGQGIIDNSMYDRGEARPIEINQSNNVIVQGIIIADSKHWSCGSYASQNVLYDRLRVISDNDWDDGIDIVGSSDITVRNCFLRTKDDCVAIKGGVDYFTPFPTFGIVRNILVTGCVLWNGVWGNALEIGFETRTDTIKNITFRNCDLIHVEGPEGTFTIHNGDRAVVTDVLYENIRVEDARGYLFDFKILFSQYSKDKQRGQIRNVIARNISVEGEHLPYSILIGHDATHSIRNIRFENVWLQGRRVRNDFDLRLTGKYADEISYQ